VNIAPVVKATPFSYVPIGPMAGTHASSIGFSLRFAGGGLYAIHQAHRESDRPKGRERLLGTVVVDESHLTEDQLLAKARGRAGATRL
jgi:hypothetical protein